MNLSYGAALAIAVAVSAGLLIVVATGRKGLMAEHQRQRGRLRLWRKQHGIRQHARPHGEPPTPFHVQSKLGDPGDPRTGVSTSDTDNLLRRSRPK